MKRGTAIVVGVTSVIAGVSFLGWKYYQGIYRLQYGFRNFGFQEQQVWVELVVNNPTRYSYPVPMLFFNVYDISGNYYGVVYSNVLQWVRPGVNSVRAYLVPNVATVVASLAALLVPGAEINLMLDGTITVGSRSLPLQIPIQQTIAL